MIVENGLEKPHLQAADFISHPKQAICSKLGVSVGNLIA